MQITNINIINYTRKGLNNLKNMNHNIFLIKHMRIRACQKYKQMMIKLNRNKWKNTNYICIKMVIYIFVIAAPIWFNGIFVFYRHVFWESLFACVYFRSTMMAVRPLHQSYRNWWFHRPAYLYTKNKHIE